MYLKASVLVVPPWVSFGRIQIVGCPVRSLIIEIITSAAYTSGTTPLVTNDSSKCDFCTFKLLDSRKAQKNFQMNALLKVPWSPHVGACSSVVLWFQVQQNCSVGLWADFVESFQLHTWCYVCQMKQFFFTSLIIKGYAFSEMHFGSVNATIMLYFILPIGENELLSAPLVEFELLGDFELLATWIARDVFAHPSVTAQSELHVLHYISSCCIYGGLVEPVRLLHLLSQWASNSLLFLLSGSVEDAPLLPVCFARWMAKSLFLRERKVVGVTHIDMKVWFPYNLTSVLVLSKCWATAGLLRIRLDWFPTCCIALLPWPPPAIFHSNIASELVETISVGSKLNVRDHVTLAASDLTLGYDELQLGQNKNHDVRYTDVKTWLDCKMTSMPICGKTLAYGFVESIWPTHTRTYNMMVTISINPVKGMSDTQVWCHGRLLFNIKDFQVPWDPGGTKIFPSAWGQAEA